MQWKLKSWQQLVAAKFDLGFRELEKIQMQSIIQEIYSLTSQLQQDNRNLLRLIQRYTPSSCQITENAENSIQSSRMRRIDYSQSKIKQFAEQTNISRVSNSTVKQKSQRHKSSQSIKQSRVTQKNLDAKACAKGVGSKKRGQIAAHEPALLRLKKISQRGLGKISSAVLLKKKSKIYHFQTHY